MVSEKRRRGLSRETRRLLAELCRAGKENRVFGMDPALVKQQAHACIDHVLERAGVGRVLAGEFRWYVDDVAAALCTDQGEALRFELDGVLAKWLGLSLEPNTLQLVLRILVRELAGTEVEAENEKPRRTRARPAPEHPVAA